MVKVYKYVGKDLYMFFVKIYCKIGCDMVLFPWILKANVPKTANFLHFAARKVKNAPCKNYPNSSKDGLKKTE